FLVVADRSFLDRFLGDGERDMPLAVHFQRTRKRGEFYRVQQPARVAAAGADQMLLRVVVDHQIGLGQSALGIVDRAVEDRPQMLFLERLELESGETRKQRRVDVEGRVLGGHSDQDDLAALYGRKQDVLLGAVEMMDLVDEEQGPPAGVADEILR